MRPKTLAHDWCADASCETCSHRHKSESQPMRPKPAVGQVWRMEDGEEFWIFNELNGGFRYIGFRGGITYPLDARFVVSAFDTYVGQFAGFKVQEETT